MSFKTVKYGRADSPIKSSCQSKLTFDNNFARTFALNQPQKQLYARTAIH